MKDFLRRFDVDRLLPPNVRRNDPEELRRARVAIYFAVALFLFAVQYAVTYASDGYYGLALWILGPALFGLLTPLVLRARQPAPAAGLYLSFLSLSVLVASGYYTGGLTGAVSIGRPSRKRQSFWACPTRPKTISRLRFSRKVSRRATQRRRSPAEA